MAFITTYPRLSGICLLTAIRAEDGGQIPHQVVVQIKHVSPT